MHYDVVKKGDAVELVLVTIPIGHPNNVVALAISARRPAHLVDPQPRTTSSANSNPASPTPRRVLTYAVGPVYSGRLTTPMARWLRPAARTAKLRVWTSPRKVADQALLSKAGQSGGLFHRRTTCC